MSLILIVCNNPYGLLLTECFYPEEFEIACLEFLEYIQYDNVHHDGQSFFFHCASKSLGHYVWIQSSLGLSLVSDKADHILHIFCGVLSVATGYMDFPWIYLNFVPVNNKCYVIRLFIIEHTFWIWCWLQTWLLACSVVFCTKTHIC